MTKKIRVAAGISAMIMSMSALGSVSVSASTVQTASIVLSGAVNYGNYGDVKLNISSGYSSVDVYRYDPITNSDVYLTYFNPSATSITIPVSKMRNSDGMLGNTVNLTVIGEKYGVKYSDTVQINYTTKKITRVRNNSTSAPVINYYTGNRITSSNVYSFYLNISNVSGCYNLFAESKSNPNKTVKLNTVGYLPNGLFDFDYNDYNNLVKAGNEFNVYALSADGKIKSKSITLYVGDKSCAKAPVVEYYNGVNRLTTANLSTFRFRISNVSGNFNLFAKSKKDPSRVVKLNTVSYLYDCLFDLDYTDYTNLINAGNEFEVYALSTDGKIKSKSITLYVGNPCNQSTGATFGTNNIPGWTMTTVFRLSNNAPATHAMAYIHLPKASIANNRLSGIVLAERVNGKLQVRKTMNRATVAPSKITNSKVKNDYNSVSANYYFYYAELNQVATIGTTYGVNSQWYLIPYYVNTNTNTRTFNTRAMKQLYRIKFTELKNDYLNNMGLKDITFYSF